jgi:hypothetical protein
VPQPNHFRTACLTCGALVAFASNSLLCRLALSPHAIDASSFTSIRLLSGAVTLAVLVRLGRRTQARAGSWTAALFLFGYAVAFSFAYLRLPVGTGALVLFGAVQATMIGWGIARGS